MNKVSVIMSTYKEPIDWIRQSIDSILNQTFSEFEFIIVVDNPKYKELISVLNDYAEADNRICIMVNENNIGLVKSLNKALSQCNGEYIVRMDADDISLPERIAHQIDYINNKKYDLVGCFYEVFYEDKTLRIAQGAKTHEVCEKILQYESCVAHPAWMVRKKVFESLGGYRDNPKSISHEKCGKQYSIAQLLAENYRIGRETEIEEYQSYLTSAEHEKLQATYKVIADIDRERSLSDSSINKLICLCRLLCFHEFRKMKKIRQRIKKWKKTES